MECMADTVKYLIFYFLIMAVGFKTHCHAQSSIQDSLLSLIQTEPQEKHAYLYNELAIKKAAEDKYAESNKLSRKALLLAKVYNNSEEEYYALTNLGFNHLDMGQIDSSLFYGKEALKIARQIGKLTLIARVYNHLGSSYNKIPLLDKALSSYLSSLQIVEDSLSKIAPEEKQNYQSLLLNNIGTVYNKLGQADKALDCFKKSLDIRRQQENLHGIASCLQNLGVVYEKMENLDSALVLYNEALELRRTLEQQGYAAELLLNIGNISIITGQLNHAEIKLREAIEIFERLNRQRFLSQSCLSLASLYLKMEKSQPAILSLNRSIEISKLHGYKIYERDAYGVLSEYYILKKDFRKATECRQKQIVLTDSIFNSEITTKVAELQARFETGKQEREIEILTKDKKLQSLKIKRNETQVYALIIVITIIVMLLLLTLLLLNRRRLKQLQIKSELEKNKLLENKLKEQNAYQSKQLTTHALNMLHKNELLQVLDHELTTFEENTDEELIKTLGKIKMQINRNRNSEKDWDLFKLHFEEVNRDFFSILQTQCNSLTTGDLKLAALIKLNLNIKEAATVLNISPDSLKKARYRLRKKLNLLERENLADHLTKIC